MFSVETKNLAPEDSLGFVASKEVLNYVLLCVVARSCALGLCTSP